MTARYEATTAVRFHPLRVGGDWTVYDADLALRVEHDIPWSEEWVAEVAAWLNEAPNYAVTMPGWVGGEIGPDDRGGPALCRALGGHFGDEGPCGFCGEGDA